MKFINYIFFYFLLFLKINFSFDIKNIINNKIQYFKKNPKKSIFFLTAGLMQLENLLSKSFFLTDKFCKQICCNDILLKIPFFNNISFIFDYFSLIKGIEKYENYFKQKSKLDYLLFNIPIYGNYHYANFIRYFK